MSGDALPLGVDLSSVAWLTVERQAIDGADDRTVYQSHDEATVCIADDLLGDDPADGTWTWQQTVLHELVHVWQHQHRNHRYLVRESDVAPVTVGAGHLGGAAIERGHGATYQLWADVLDLPPQGRGE